MRTEQKEMEIVMNERFYDDAWDNEPQAIGEILDELLAQYEARFPGVHIAVVETTATAA